MYCGVKIAGIHSSIGYSQSASPHGSRGLMHRITMAPIRETFFYIVSFFLCSGISSLSGIEYSHSRRSLLVSVKNLSFHYTHGIKKGKQKFILTNLAIPFPITKIREAFPASLSLITYISYSMNLIYQKKS